MMLNRVHRYALAALLAGMLLLAAAPAPAWQAPVAPAELASRVETAVKFVARKQHLAVDPAIVVDMTADAANFVGNFCGPYAGQGADPCASTFDDAAALRASVDAFLRDALSLAPHVETLASRMARQAGLAMADAGWSSERVNNMGVLVVPAALRGATLDLRTASGNVPLGRSVDKILILQGSHAIVAKLGDGETRVIDVLVRARIAGSWESGAGASAALAGRIGATQAHYCPKDAATLRAPAIYPFNEGRAMLGESERERLAHLVPAALQGGLDIRVSDETGACDDDCLDGLGHAFAEAVAVWRSGCTRCDRNALAVLRIGKRVWLERRAADRLRGLVADKAAADWSTVGDRFPLFGMRPGEDRSRPMHILDLARPAADDAPRLLPPSLSVPLGVIVAYEQVDQETALVRTLCKISDAGTVSWVGVAQGFLCRAAPAARLTLRPMLVIRNMETACGPGAIACAVGGGRIQLDTSHFLYTIATPAGERVLGNGVQTALPIRHIVIHEVGHWFGIPHPERVDVAVSDVMSGVMDPGRQCVTAESLTMLNNAADDRWPYRAQGLQGLRPPVEPQRRGPPVTERR